MHREISIEVSIDEDDTNTLVNTVLDLGGDHFEATGRARRNPADASMPIIGEELALARALGDLQIAVMSAAQEKIEEHLTK